jgi:chitodextrinase
VRSRLFSRVRLRRSICLLTFLIVAVPGVRSPVVTAESGSFNFVLATAGSRSVARGSSVSNTVAAILISGSPKSVPFNASGLPPGAIATFTVTSCVPTCSTDVVIDTSASTPLGTWTITVTGRVSGVTRTTAFTLTVTAASATDTTAPMVVLTAPANGSAIAGSSVAVTAAASDDAGVVGVQFLLDGLDLDREVAAAPYGLTWDTTAAADGPHTLSASAWDAAGNTTTAASVGVLVDNGLPAGSVVIGGDAAVTNSSTVTLALSATDAVSPVTQMRFSNSGSAYSPAEPYGPTKTWTLSPSSGTKTVSVQFMDAAGNWSAAATDTILLDVTAPAVSGVTASNIQKDAATITWTTDEPAKSQVEYGSGTTFTSVTALDGTLVTAHTVVIPGLSAGTAYVYRVRSRDAVSNESIGATNTFTTLTAPDTTPPSAPNGVSATATSTSTVAVHWLASADNVAVTGYDVYRDGTRVATVASTSYSDINLQPSTTYSYGVSAFDAANNHSALSTAIAATTHTPPDQTPPSVFISSPANAAIVSGTLTISASAQDDVAVAGVVFQVDGRDVGTQRTTAPYFLTWDTTTSTDGPHALSARARDAAGNTTTAASVGVLVDNGLPAGTVVIGGDAAVTNTSAVTLTLSATDAVSQVTQMRFSNSGTAYSSAEPYSPAKTWTLSAGSGPKTVYAQFMDAAGNWSPPATDTILLDVTAPTVSGVTASNIQKDAATITWTTDEPAKSQVEYGSGMTFTNLTPFDSALVTAHTVVIPGLSARTAYVYRVRSRDAVANESIGATNTFTTLTPPDTTPPSAPGGVSATATSTSTVAVHWLASADDLAVAGYDVYRDGTRVATVTSTVYSDANLLPSTTYSYTVSAFDAANNHSAQSSASAATTQAQPDQTPPSVFISSPANAATVSGTLTITASAADDVALAGVGFQVDGRDIGTELTTAPFTASVNTTKLADGDHVFTAIARDTSDNTAVSSPVSLTVSNTAPAGVPTLIQHVTTSSNYDPTELGNNFRIHLADPALANNCIILGIRYPDAPGRTVTIADDRGNTWLSGPTVSNNGIRSRIFYATGVVAGTRDITVTFDKALSGFQAQISEFYNVAVNFALDGASGRATSANPAIAAGGVTTTTPGDLIYNYVTTNDFGAPITAITSGAGFTLLSADRLRASATQYAVQTAAGVVNPAMTVTSLGGSMNSLAIALKAATAGTAPAPGIRVVHVYHGYWLGTQAKLQFPSTGNLLVLATSFGTGNSNISSIASTPANAWTKVTLAPVSITDPQVLYAANATTTPDLEFAITASLKFVQFVMYDVTGASTAPFDGAAKASGSDLANEPIFSAPQISSTGSGLIIATLPMGHGPPVTCTTSGCLFDGVTYPGEADGSTFESSDGYAHLYHPTPGWTSFDWQPAAVDLPSAWFALAVGFR